jgi:homoserine dehydrogenase
MTYSALVPRQGTCQDQHLTASAMPLNVALFGFGTVGRAVARILADRQLPLRVTHVCNRNVARKKVEWLPPDTVWSEDPGEVLAGGADVVVETMGGLEPAGTIVRRALGAGTPVVTANKQLIAHHGAELLALAASSDAELAFEASVGGGIPVICGIRDGLAGDRLVAVSGSLNGTSNYILTRMASGETSFDDALAEAQARGFAEADPSDDVDGHDARAKLCILARVALGVDLRPDEVGCRSIRPLRRIDFTYARRLQCTIRQAAHVERAGQDAVVAWVQPALVPLGSPLAQIDGGQNLVLAIGESGASTSFAGLGAGGGPTAVAVVSDLLAIARGHRSHLEPAARPARVLHGAPAPPYLRFIVRDRPGIIADLARVLAQHDINIDAVLQEPHAPKDALPFVVTLEAADPVAVQDALSRIAHLDFHVEPPLVLPFLT